jgi:predicted Zn finger-like uncharacterized protein
MRVDCPSCATRYEIADEKVAGKLAKLRCKRCGELVLIDARPPPEPPARTGERNESSVLFSLAMLARHEPPKAPEPAPAADIVNLSAGGPFAPALAPPVLPVQPEEPRSSAPAWAAAALAALVVAGLAIAAATLRRDAAPRPPGRAPAAPPPPATTAAPTPSALAATAPRVEPPAPSAKPARPPRPVAAAPSHTIVQAVCCPGETETACAIRRSVGAACAVPAFDVAATRRALAAVDLASCQRGGGPSGAGHVTLTLDPHGTVASAVLDGAPFAGTSVGACIARRYRGVRVPAFSGGPVTVGKSFRLE